MSFVFMICIYDCIYDCTKNNFQDTFHHLWDRSRPTIVEMERKIKRKKAKLIISTEIEALVESLFLEE